MGIQQVTPKREVLKYLKNGIEKFEDKVIRTLQYVGETCLNEARDNGSYMDQTGNLRSSLGYVIVKDGVIIKKAGFEKVKEGEEGARIGDRYIRDKIDENRNGIVLIVVAGMNYASHVEARGRNVLNSSELLAIKLVPSMLKKLGLK